MFESTNIIETETEVEAWVKTCRVSKTFGFLEVSDGSTQTNLQLVFDEKLKNFAEICSLRSGASIRAKGKIIESPGKQPIEMQVINLEVISNSAEDYPLQKKRHSFEYLRTISHLRPRSNTFSAVFRVRSLISYLIHSYFFDNDFIYVHTPIISGSDCEGAGEMFRVTTLENIEKGKTDFTKDFFGKETHLTVSGQLEGEAYAMAFKNIYTFGPTFRAENSNTTRHASEFWMIEPEMAFANLKTDMALAEDLLKYLLREYFKRAEQEISFFDKFIEKGLEKKLQNVIDNNFEQISYTEAIKILQDAKQNFEYKIAWGADLQTEHERFLCEQYFKVPVFVTDYPKEIKAFYMKANADNKTVAAMDLLVPGVGEIIGGSQRETNIELLEKRIKELNQDRNEYKWYLELRKYGGVEHAGFGLGFERLLMYVTGMSNIRDVIAFPRTPKNAEF